MNLTDTQAVRGDIVLTLRDRTGAVVERIEERNLVVDAGKTALARLLGGDTTGRSVNRVGFGTGTSAAAAGDTALTTPVYKTATVTYPTATQVRFAFTLEYSEGNGLAITEFGLITSNTTLFARRVRAAINKTSDLRLEGTWTIQF